MPTPPLEAPRPPDTCKTCRFYRADRISESTGHTVLWFQSKSSDEPCGYGECHKQPPAMFGRDDYEDTRFPAVNEDNWCGEWEAIT